MSGNVSNGYWDFLKLFESHTNLKSTSVNGYWESRWESNLLTTESHNFFVPIIDGKKI